MISFLFFQAASFSQEAADSARKQETNSKADDPANFITRIEVYNELQRYDKTDVYLNQTIFRSIIRIGKKFSTRIDIPYVYNSLKTPKNDKQCGLGDISFRLLGFKFIEKPFSAFTVSLEVSLNTAESKLLGSGKNILIPSASYTRVFAKQKFLLAGILQQANSISGEDDRKDISFTKFQVIALKYFSRKFWTVGATDWYYDYKTNQLSLNLRSRLTYAPTRRLNFWTSPSVGVFGDFVGRYTWGTDLGFRYFLFKEKKKS